MVREREMKKRSKAEQAARDLKAWRIRRGRALVRAGWHKDPARRNTAKPLLGLWEDRNKSGDHFIP